MALDTDKAATLAADETFIDRVEIANVNFATLELANQVAVTTNEQVARNELSIAVLDPDNSVPLAEQMAKIISSDASDSMQSMIDDTELNGLVLAAWNTLAAFFSG